MDTGYVLTKSKYIRGLQCERAMWLDVHNPNAGWYPAETLARFRMGRDFERGFKSTFPQGIDISRRLRSQISRYPVLTAKLLQKPGEVVLFEAGFVFDGVLVLADVVHKEADGMVSIYEVKHGTTVSDTFRNDVTVQHYVIGHALPLMGVHDLFCEGLQIEHFYVLYSDGEGGFAKEDLTDDAHAGWEEVARNVAQFRETLQGGEPDIPMSPHCDNPYECPYKRYCSRRKK
ncbi:MAG: hypothetical protein J5641_03070 [Bacteroidales bacterium]|nr:hypothetical protein [Bacteroidales bacterium]